MTARPWINSMSLVPSTFPRKSHLWKKCARRRSIPGQTCVPPCNPSKKLKSIIGWLSPTAQPIPLSASMWGAILPSTIFDRNQGEKLRTQLDIDRNDKLMQASKAQVFSDVDSAYATVTSTLILLKPYKEKYLQQATRVRDTIQFSYEHGAASLLDFLNAQADYRSVQVNYLNLVASYLDAANQLNLAVGREVIQ
jgi:cobalt-zinc-cadmium efflux system outer membrane protein